ncbi:glycosyltransferase family 9 protein [Flavobacterium subsaxonicum]|uniref:glycosyltransferase family 9 protein n=1 Tax=Flavobacterium subsaxonicum TaxID=426226 RepID=UPI00040B252E|nr:glycosyltransferase family 9 protein [Flavobacterium subsaxonicum]
MNVLKKINNTRRNVMRSITKNIGSSSADTNVRLSSKATIKRVLICRPNHRLGNLLLTTPLVQEVAATFPDCKIDLFVKGGLAPILFENYSYVDRIIKLPKKHFKQLHTYLSGWFSLKTRRYDIVINVAEGSSSGRLSAQFTNAKYKFFGEVDADTQLKHPDQVHIAKHPVYSFRNHIARLGITPNSGPVPLLDLKLSPDEIAEGKKTLAAITGNPDKKTICLYTFATGSKCYCPTFWDDFYSKLKAEYPNHNVIEVLPVENISQITHTIPKFYSTDIRNIGAVIANTCLFIGADCGIMHLASAAHTPTVGLFSGNNIEKYQPYGNNSIAISTNSGCTTNWLEVINSVLTANKCLQKIGA